MALTKEAKQDIIAKHGRGEADTGSPQVQIAMLTQRINEPTEHLRPTSTTITRGVGCSSSSGGAAAS